MTLIISSLMERYHLIIDEALDVIRSEEVYKDDIKAMHDSGFFDMEKTRRIIWLNEQYNGTYSRIMKDLQSGDIYCIDDESFITDMYNLVVVSPSWVLTTV